MDDVEKTVENHLGLVHYAIHKWYYQIPAGMERRKENENRQATEELIGLQDRQDAGENVDAEGERVLGKYMLAALALQRIQNEF